MDSNLETVRQNVIECTKCDLCKTRTNSVPGKGNFNSDVIFVGEAPGRNEDLRGEPFVGVAGKKLSAALENAGISRDEIYITNTVKCRPPNNRNPSSDEIRNCQPFLRKQIEIIKPEIILCLGSVSFHYMSGSTMSISKARGRIFDLDGIKLIPTFHPSYLLRTPSAKKEAYKDMLLIKSLLSQ